MAGVFLDDHGESVFRVAGGINFLRGVGAFDDAGQGRVAGGIGVDDEQRARRDESQHFRPVEFRINSRHDTVVKFLNERGVGIGHACVFRDRVKRRLNRVEAFD